MSKPWRKFERAYEQALEEVAPEHDPGRQLAALLGSVDRAGEARRRRRWLAWVTLPAAAAAAVAAAMILWPSSSPHDSAAVTCATAAGQPAREGDRLAPTSDRALTLRFSEGTVVEVEPEARARLLKLEARRVDFALETGRIRARVTPGRNVSWHYHAGPYWVQVLGTTLSIEWSPGRRQLEVAVQAGRVRVRGARISAAGVEVGAGQRLEAQPTRVVVHERKPSADAGSVAPDAVATADASSDGGGETAAKMEAPRSRRPDKSRQQRRWLSLARAGHYEAAWRALDRGEIRRLTARLGRRDLLLLADLVRLRGPSDRAHEVLLALRKRFPGTREARLATLRLGRLAAEAHADYAQAVRWYRRLLVEAPASELAERARGRLMLGLDKLGHAAEADGVARDYLRLHPRGKYGDLARSLLERAR